MWFLRRSNKQHRFLLAAWGIICSLLLLQLLITEGLRPELFTQLQIIAIPLVRFVVGLVLVFTLILPGYNFLIRRSQALKTLGFISIGLLFSLLYVGLGTWLLLRLDGPVPLEAFLGTAIEDYLSNLHHIITYYLMLLAILLSVDYLRDKVAAVSSSKQLERELAETRLQVLKNQLQPHFLFNALNSVTSIIGYQPAKAQDMLVDISTLLRTSLRTDYAQPILLEQEVRILQIYLDIEQGRFEHQLSTEISLDPKAQTKTVPPFILQPLAENAIKHGYRAGSGQLSIKLKAGFTNGTTIITLANDGAPLQVDKVGLGLENVRQRLRQCFGDKAECSLTQEGRWVVNRIQIRE